MGEEGMCEEEGDVWERSVECAPPGWRLLAICMTCSEHYDVVH